MLRDRNLKYSDTILKESSNAKSELVLLEWTRRLCLRFVLLYEPYQHFYHCHVWCDELRVACAILQ